MAVREPKCIPEGRFSDIVFAVDVSNYMREIINGKSSPELARDWMRAIIAQVDMTHAKIGLVQFHRDLWVEELTNDRQAVLNAIATDPPFRSGTTRMDLALRQSRNMLLGSRATPGNGKVIVFISMMQAKSVPWKGVPGCVSKRGEECAVIHAAEEVKASSPPITIYALALTWYGGGEDLKAVASDLDKAMLLPGDAELAKIVSQVQVYRPCPPGWPRAMP